MNKLLVILGPTATGKTDTALKLAEQFNGELVACDSRQVYTGLDIGSGKEPGRESVYLKGEGYWIVDGIKIRMYDVLSPEKQYSVWDYMNDAGANIESVSREKKLPVLVGGSGLYLRALLNGLDYINVPADNDLRSRLETLDLEEIREKLISLSPALFDSLNNSEKNNKRRLIRKIELLSPAGRISSANSPVRFRALSDEYNILKIGISASKEILNNRIDLRVDKRLKRGMIEEAEKLYSEGLSLSRMRELGLEYGVLADYLEGKFSGPDEAGQVLKHKIHRYAKRQMTWFKKEEGVVWFDITDPQYTSKVEKMVRDWYNAG